MVAINDNIRDNQCKMIGFSALVICCLLLHAIIFGMATFYYLRITSEMIEINLELNQLSASHEAMRASCGIIHRQNKIKILPSSFTPPTTEKGQRELPDRQPMDQFSRFLHEVSLISKITPAKIRMNRSVDTGSSNSSNANISDYARRSLIPKSRRRHLSPNAYYEDWPAPLPETSTYPENTAENILKKNEQTAKVKTTTPMHELRTDNIDKKSESTISPIGESTSGIYSTIYPPALHVTGHDEPNNLNENDHEQNFKRLVAQWAESDWMLPLGMRQYFQLANGEVDIMAPGLYFVYAQVLYTDAETNNTFVVQRNKITFLQCAVANSPRPGFGIKRTCFTAGVALLFAGDKITVVDLSKRRYSGISTKDSFLGIMRI